MKEPLSKHKIQKYNYDVDGLLQELTNKHEKIKLFLILIPRRNNLYCRVKLAFSRAGTPTQFLNKYNPKNPRKNRTILGNVLKQMVCKIGKRLWRVQRGITSDKGATTMLIGIEIVRFKRGHLVSAVGTVDHFFSRFYNQFDYVSAKNKSRNELKNFHAKIISNIVRILISKYMKETERQIKSVVIFRSGMGNSMGQRRDGLEEARLVAAEIGKKFKQENGLKLAYILVSKRIDDRFFEKNGSTHVYNPKGGLIVEQRVTTRDRFDYYMVAQKVTQGSANPTHYFVVYNTTDLGSDEFYKLTYFQTFNYYNWQGPIKVPAVCMYASKHNELMSNVLRQMRDPANVRNLITKTLHFL